MLIGTRIYGTKDEKKCVQMNCMDAKRQFCDSEMRALIRSKMEKMARQNDRVSTKISASKQIVAKY